MAFYIKQSEEDKLVQNWQQLCKLKENKKFLMTFKPMVSSIVRKYKYYGISQEDLEQEAWTGTCIALHKYNPSYGIRFSSYAKWWVNAYCQDYVMRNWSIVRVGTTRTHKKLFFQLRYLKRALEKVDAQYFEPEIARTIAKNLNISVREVQNMYDKIMQKDKYLDQQVNPDQKKTFTDTLADTSSLIDSILIEKEEQNLYVHLFNNLSKFLNERELDILLKRHIEDPPQTLEVLSNFYGITKERVRQIEKHAMRKLQKPLKLLRLSSQHY